MEGERSFATRTLKVVGFGLLAFAITILAGGIWSGLVVANLQSTPAVPWSVPLMALLLPRREGVAAQYFGSATTLPTCQAKIRPDVPMGMGRGRSVGSRVGWILDRAVPIGQDAAQRALGCVALSPNDCGTHDYDGVVRFSFDGRGRVSWIFPGCARTRVSRPSRSRDRIGSVCACARPHAGLPVAQASFLLSRRCRVRGDGPPHQFDPARYPGSRCGAPDLLHLYLAAGCRTTAGLGGRD